MAVILSLSETIKAPKYDYRGGADWNKDEKRYIDEMRAWCKEHSKDKDAGEIIKIPHADSYAQYMVFTTKPVQLFHMEVGDCWDSEFADLLTTSKVKEMITREKNLAKLFGGR